MSASPVPPGAPPESAGPGTDDPGGSGEVVYGAPRTGTAFVEPAMPAWQRDRDMAERARNARCPRCMSVPDAVVQATATALAEAYERGRRGQPL